MEPFEDRSARIRLIQITSYWCNYFHSVKALVIFELGLSWSRWLWNESLLMKKGEVIVSLVRPHGYYTWQELTKLHYEFGMQHVTYYWLFSSGQRHKNNELQITYLIESWSLNREFSKDGLSIAQNKQEHCSTYGAKSPHKLNSSKKSGISSWLIWSLSILYFQYYIISITGKPVYLSLQWYPMLYGIIIITKCTV